tara:strand:- start:433 stop:600 length:168 start_codon:yes stop_codon:yes gene_type:complete
MAENDNIMAASFRGRYPLRWDGPQVEVEPAIGPLASHALDGLICTSGLSENSVPM